MCSQQATARPEAPAEGARNDWLPRLDEELSRLPEKYRLPLVVCDLEGKTRREASEQLGWPEGTVAGRLARGRAMLARRLLRGAPALSEAPPVLVVGAAPAAVTPEMIGATARAATLIGSGQVAATGAPSVAATTLAGGVMRSMFWKKLRIGATALLAFVLLGGAGGLTYSALAGGTVR